MALSKAFRLFQFTLPRGERLRKEIDAWTYTCFNSRSRGGSDWQNRGGARPPRGFNSRSRGGSDITEAAKQLQVSEFQFTLPRGERLA